MRQCRFIPWIGAFGFLLLTVGLSLMQSTVASWGNLNGPQPGKMLTANVNPMLDPDGSAGLTREEAEQFSARWGLPVQFQSAMTATVSMDEGWAGGSSLDGPTKSVNLIGVSDGYLRFHSLQFSDGAMMTGNAVEEHSLIAVIRSDLAEGLFQTSHVVGLKIIIGQRAFTIAGVYDEPDNLLRTMSENGMPDVIIPLTTMLDDDEKLAISMIKAEASEDAIIYGDAQMKVALQAIGKNAAAYKIMNNVELHKQITQKPAILLWIMGRLIILICIYGLFIRFRQLLVLFRSELLTKEFREVWNSHRTKILRKLAVIFTLTLLIIGLHTLTSYSFYIAAQWIPERFIDLSFYWNQIVDRWQKTVLWQGYVASKYELIAVHTRQMLNAELACCLLLGLPISFGGAREWFKAGFPLYSWLRMLLMMEVVALGIAFVLSRIFGFISLIDWKSNLIVLGFAFFVGFYYYDRQQLLKVVIKNDKNETDE